MAAWHIRAVDRDIAVGSNLRLNPKPGLVFARRTEDIVAGDGI
jgi:hypothetical protein